MLLCEYFNLNTELNLICHLIHDIKKYIRCIWRTEHVLEELDICAIKVYVYYYASIAPCPKFWATYLLSDNSVHSIHSGKKNP